MHNRARVLIDCPDAKGLIYKVSKLFYELSLNIESNREFVDLETGQFFMRSVVTGKFETHALQKQLDSVIPNEANLRIVEPSKKPIVLMATKESHVLGELLVRHASGELDATITGVVANHEDLRELVERFDIPFVCVESKDLDREIHEQRIIEALGQFEFEYIVLAKYMRILTPQFVSKFKGKVINIHHSFLPAFIGANPYKQAYERGVKIIGATAHFVTDDLDEGPIIAQDVVSVNHRQSWQDMRRSGRSVEMIVLSRALDLVLNDRVFVNGNKTIVF